MRKWKYKPNPRRWSKLKKKIEAVFYETLNLQIHCNVYSYTDKHCTYKCPRQWLVLGKEIIFDFPGSFFEEKNPEEKSKIKYWEEEARTLGHLIDQYLETPRVELLNGEFPLDRWGFTDLLKAADRRLGKAKLIEKFKDVPKDSAIWKILAKRIVGEIKTGEDIDEAFEAGVDATELFDFSKEVKHGSKNAIDSKTFDKIFNEGKENIFQYCDLEKAIRKPGIKTKQKSKSKVAPPAQDLKLLKEIALKIMGARAHTVMGIAVKPIVERLQSRFPGFYDRIDPNLVCMVAEFSENALKEFSNKAILLNAEDAVTVARIRKNTLDKIKTPPDGPA